MISNATFVDDILTDPQGRVLIRLGDSPAPIPSPFDDVVRSHLRSRDNLETATNPNSTWLFPGRRAGQPLHQTSIRLRLTTLGIPNMPGRSRALREMVLQASPAVVASMLVFHVGRAETIAAETGATWKRYADDAVDDLTARLRRKVPPGPNIRRSDVFDDSRDRTVLLDRLPSRRLVARAVTLTFCILESR